MTDSVGSVIRSGSPHFAWTENRQGYKSKLQFLVSKSYSKVLLAKSLIKLCTALYYDRKAVRIENTTVKLCGIDRARWVDGPSIFYFVPTRPHRKESPISVQNKTAFFYHEILQIARIAWAGRGFQWAVDSRSVLGCPLRLSGCPRRVPIYFPFYVFMTPF